MQKFDSLLMGSFWKPYMSRFTDEAACAELKAKFADIEAFMADNMNGKDFLSGRDQPMYIDIHCFVMAERLILLEKSVWDHAFEKLEIKALLPMMYAYVFRMQAHPSFAKYIAETRNYHAQLELQEAKPVGEKAQLSIDYLTKA